VCVCVSVQTLLCDLLLKISGYIDCVPLVTTVIEQYCPLLVNVIFFEGLFFNFASVETNITIFDGKKKFMEIMIKGRPTNISKGL